MQIKYSAACKLIFHLNVMSQGSTNFRAKVFKTTQFAGRPTGEYQIARRVYCAIERKKRSAG